MSLSFNSQRRSVTNSSDVTSLTFSSRVIVGSISSGRGRRVHRYRGALLPSASPGALSGRLSHGTDSARVARHGLHRCLLGATTQLVGPTASSIPDRVAF